MAAETVLIPIAKQILCKAADLAVEQIGLLWNFRRELGKLKDTVSTIQAVLRDAEEKQFHDHQVKNWLEKLSNVMYDVDDMLDDISTEARRKAMTAADDGTTTRTTCWSLVCFLFSSLPEQLMYDLKMAHAIKAIREMLDVISEDKETFHLEVRSEEEAPPFRETDSCPPTIIVGREDDKKNISHLLLNTNLEANISVIPIVGMGGLGKTTLAQLVFDDDRVKSHFDIKVWVYVSQSFDIKVILGKMLQSINGRSYAGCELDYLQSQLRENIKGKRFLFALDDVWEENVGSWEVLAKYLIVGALGSKVLVTTRSAKVAEVGGRTLKTERSTRTIAPYLLKGLSLEESWNLMVKKALPRKIPQDPFLKEIGREILMKCGGVPLAVSTIASMLVSSEDPRADWSSFLQKGLWSFSEAGNPTMSALQLSFNHLPSYMRHCFAYCKLFPKGHKFDVQRLVYYWVAQGYIETEDKGLDCFKMLWWRSFFQEVETGEQGSISSCRMHDLMHDLANLITGEKILRSSSSNALRNITLNTRHLYFSEEEKDDDIAEEANNDVELGNATRVRTLLCEKSFSGEDWERVLQNFKCLRVLKMPVEGSNSGDSTQVHSVGSMKHLRYLDFECEGVERLPEPITNLLNLQVLMVSSSSLKELPKDTKKLVNLRHFFLHPDHLKHFTYMPKGIAALKSLQTLPFFVVGKKSSSNDKMVAGLDELKGLNALGGVLIITNLANADILGIGVYVLKNKPFLRSLVLNWSRGDVTPASIIDEEILEMLCPHPNLMNLTICGGYGGLKLPNCLSGLTNLVEISLENCMHCKNLPPWHQISCLKKLKIENCPQLEGTNNYAGGADHCGSSPNASPSTTEKEDDEWPRFLSLAYLCIRDCPKLTGVPAFPTVEDKLELKNTSLAPLVRTMKLRRGAGVEYSNEYASMCEYDDLDVPLLRCPSSSFLRPLSRLAKLILQEIDDNLDSLPDDDDDFSSCLISLQELSVWICRRGVRLPSSLCSSSRLTKIDLHWCQTIEYLPPLYKLPLLRKLIIEHCRKLRGCRWKKGTGSNHHSGFGNNNNDHHYDHPSMEEENEDHEEEDWPHFLCLSSLTIEDCPKLTQMPLFPTTKGWLELKRTSSQSLIRTLKIKVAAAHPDSPSVLVSSLSKLTTVFLGELHDLESLPEEGLHNLTSLKRLVIWDCPRLATLPPAMRNLTSLEALRIWGCPLLTERCRKGEGEDWPNISHIPYIQLDIETVQDYSGN